MPRKKTIKYGNSYRATNINGSRLDGTTGRKNYTRKRWRQTYLDRKTAGKAGKFEANQKILFRYNLLAAGDKNFIRDLMNDIHIVEDEMYDIGMRTLIHGRKVMKDALLKYTPVDTGKLRNSWEVDINEETMEIEWHNEMEYASYQEYGFYTKKGEWIPGYFMVTRALHEAELEMKSFAEKQTKRIKRT